MDKRNKFKQVITYILIVVLLVLVAIIGENKPLYKKRLFILPQKTKLVMWTINT